MARPQHLAGGHAAHDRRDRPGARREPAAALGLRVQERHARAGRRGAAAADHRPAAQRAGPPRAVRGAGPGARAGCRRAASPVTTRSACGCRPPTRRRRSAGSTCGRTGGPGLPVDVRMFARGAAVPVGRVPVPRPHRWPAARLDAGLLAAARRPGAHRRRGGPGRRGEPVRRAGAARRPWPACPRAGPRRRADQGSVGVYGRGPTVLLALPLWHRTADRVREDLCRQPGSRARSTPGCWSPRRRCGCCWRTPEPNDSSWLLAGTVTRKALVDAARQLAESRPGLRLP